MAETLGIKHGIQSVMDEFDLGRKGMKEIRNGILSMMNKCRGLENECEYMKDGIQSVKKGTEEIKNEIQSMMKQSQRKECNQQTSHPRKSRMQFSRR